MTDKPPNNSELALLTLLVEGAQHGYQLEQIIEARGLREWTEIGFSSIYYLLNKMEDKGWVTSVLMPEEGKPARKVFQLTEGGLAVTVQAVQQRLAAPRYLSGDFMLGLANQYLIPPAERLAAMQTCREHLAERYAIVEQKWRHARTPETPMTPVVNDLFDHSLKMLQAELEWLDGWIERNRSVNSMLEDGKEDQDG